MNYQHHYNVLIERQKNRILEGYTERHHIVPRCIGGKDVPENLVDLTAREHYVQHQLLAKIYPDEPKLSFAAYMMSVSSYAHARTENRRYQWVRERHQKYMSELMKGRQTGENNSQFGTKWIHKGTESKKVPKDSLKQWLDDGWVQGRKIKEGPTKEQLKRTSQKNRKIEKTSKMKQFAKETYEIYARSNENLRDFAQRYDISHAGLIYRWKRYVDEYSPNPKMVRGNT